MTKKVNSWFLPVSSPSVVAIQAQSNYAIVRGSILDPQHRPIAGAQIHVVTRGDRRARASRVERHPGSTRSLAWSPALTR